MGSADRFSEGEHVRPVRSKCGTGDAMKIFIFFFFFKIQKFKFDQVDVFWLLQPAGLGAIVVRLIEREREREKKGNQLSGWGPQ